MLKNCLVALLCVSLFSALGFAASIGTGFGGTYDAGQGSPVIGAFDWSGVVGADVISQTMQVGTSADPIDGRNPLNEYLSANQSVEYMYAYDATNLYVTVTETVVDYDNEYTQSGHIEGVSGDSQLYNKDAFALMFNDRTDTGTLRDLVIGFASSGQTDLAYGRDEAWANTSAGISYAGTVSGGLRTVEVSVPLAMLDITGPSLRIDGLLIDPWDDVPQLPFYSPIAYNWQSQSFQGGGLWAIGADATNYTYINVPEPVTMVLLGLGGLLMRRKR
jgi:hypothetical protein